MKGYLKNSETGEELVLVNHLECIRLTSNIEYKVHFFLNSSRFIHQFYGGGIEVVYFTANYSRDSQSEFPEIRKTLKKLNSFIRAIVTSKNPQRLFHLELTPMIEYTGALINYTVNTGPPDRTGQYNNYSVDFVFLNGIPLETTEKETAPVLSAAPEATNEDTEQEKKIVDIIYFPQENEYYACTEDDLVTLEKSCKKYDDFIEEFHNKLSKTSGSNDGLYESKEVAKIKNDFSKKIGLAKGNDLTEIIKGGTKGGKIFRFTDKSGRNNLKAIKLSLSQRKKMDSENSKATKGKKGIDMKAFRKEIQESLKDKIKSGPKYDIKLINKTIANDTLFNLGTKDNHAEAYIFGDPESESDRFTTSLGASWLRYSAGVSAKTSFDSLTELGLSGDVSAKLDLISGEGKMNGYFPSQGGYNFKLTDPDKNELDLGKYRLKLEFKLSAGVGAQAILGAGVEIDVKKIFNKHGVEGHSNSAKFKSGSPFDLTSGPASAEASVDLFAGAKADAKLSGSAQWKNPENDNKWSSFGSMGCGVGGAVGVGITADMFVGLDSYGRFCARFKVRLVAGLGGEASYVVSVDATTMGSFFIFLWDCSRKSNFDFSKYMSDDAELFYLHIISDIFLSNPKVKAILEIGKLLGDTIIDFKKDFKDWTKADDKNGTERGEDIKNELKDSVEERKRKAKVSPRNYVEARDYLDEKKDFASEITSKKDELKCLLPLAKGMIMNELVHRPSEWDVNWTSSEVERTAALNCILSTFDHDKKEEEFHRCVSDMDSNKTYDQNINHLQNYILRPGSDRSAWDELDRFLKDLDDLSLLKN